MKPRRQVAEEIISRYAGRDESTLSPADGALLLEARAIRAGAVSPYEGIPSAPERIAAFLAASNRMGSL